ncbi:MAG: hypothetical protein A2513_04110 [Sulfurimonas sp. RIFOXYD12_FULL_33_39]|uniref:hypothetical protein n=1 Tax=unclassified Sulfurimonas TaxID=2623549 RepID=UPI0008D5585D|nr:MULTISPECIES: hypothetical protein [unclassified Sulfurimonas]OHE09321.1 MAG: hypothetical protein A2513_04110 [Sulfurimonas sp. RIFOXYD12_FULL_33_39]OHE12896.1 MAG: hypothetical protein A2530_04695 [Sulfurimonas sp. RIFOXYD2_FULL_34_21]
MDYIKNSKFEKAVIDIKILGDNYLLVSDSATTIRYLDYETLEIKNQLKANAVHERYVNNVVYLSPDADYLALISTGARESKLYDTKTKKLIGMVNRHQGEVSCVAIDPKTKYMFSGGDDGITFGVDIKSGQLAFTLPRHIDTINDIAFSKSGQWVATASYDKNIAIFNLITMTPKDRLKAHSAPVVKLQFLSKNRLISIDKKSSAIVWDIISSKIVARLNGIHDDVTAIAVGCDESFLFLGTKLGYILVYDLKTYEQISMKYIKLESTVTALNFDEAKNHLLIGTENGDLLIYDIFEDEKAMYEMISYKKYHLLQGYIDKNPLLVYTKAYLSFDELWVSTLQKAKELIESGNKQGTTKLFEGFMEIPSKKQQIQKLLAQYAEFDKFLLLVTQNRYALAYPLANVNPIFKETKAYKTMEMQWKKSISIAQKYMLNSNNHEKIKEIFAPYRGVAEKTAIIQDLMVNSALFNRFKSALVQKSFKLAFELAKKHPFLKETAEYNALINYSDTIYMKAKNFEKSGDTHAAVKIYRILVDFEDFKDEAKELIDDMEHQHKFYAALAEKDIATAYNILDDSDTLQYSQEGMKLEEAWENDYLTASRFAAKASVDGVKNTLLKYMNIKSKFMAIATAVSWCYITQLNIALKNKTEQKIIENGIKNYILYYGLSDQITTFFTAFVKEYPNTKLVLESQVQGSIEVWKPSMIVNSILD